jgi:hypothetical protein
MVPSPAQLQNSDILPQLHKNFHFPLQKLYYIPHFIFHLSLRHRRFHSNLQSIQYLIVSIVVHQSREGDEYGYELVAVPSCTGKFSYATVTHRHNTCLGVDAKRSTPFTRRFSPLLRQRENANPSFPIGLSCISARFVQTQSTCPAYADALPYKRIMKISLSALK